jgi:hypothetical protein
MHPIGCLAFEAADFLSLKKIIPGCTKTISRVFFSMKISLFIALKTPPLRHIFTEFFASLIFLLHTNS